MSDATGSLSDTFKTAWFSKAAKKAQISDRALCKAIEQVARGQADDLGGGVFKKRLNDNRHRSIVLAKAGEYWVFAYLFAKEDRANIDDDELLAFRKLAELYRRKTQAELDAEIGIGALLEICNGDQAQVQERCL
ncbi:type II toxin-antitoxin system RelE/ParE family toxin [Ensifer sp. ENS12]|uniref:type II toxin-antitoxin system RelE/ParE family toxin n=1 Tax=Ensifer sp. ENS12 TaxID=2854774 RepID=UPI000AA27644